MMDCVIVIVSRAKVMGEKIRGGRNNDLDLTDKNRALDTVSCLCYASYRLHV